MGQPTCAQVSQMTGQLTHADTFPHWIPSLGLKFQPSIMCPKSLGMPGRACLEICSARSPLMPQTSSLGVSFSWWPDVSWLVQRGGDAPIGGMYGSWFVPALSDGEMGTSCSYGLKLWRRGGEPAIRRGRKKSHLSCYTLFVPRLSFLLITCVTRTGSC